MSRFILTHPVISLWISGILYAATHSLLAAPACKSRIYALGVSPRAYRLGYVIIALAATALWLAFVRSLPDISVYRIEGIARRLLQAVQVAGLWVFWLALKPIDVPAFLGLRPFRDDVEPFRVLGIYRHVRHPMYAAGMLVMFAHPDQSLNSLNLFACIAVYFLLGSRLEERRMIAQHPDYTDYRRRVPAFIPRPATWRGKR